MRFTPLTEDDQPTIKTFNKKFAEAIGDAVRESIVKNLQVVTGSYIGTGKYGADYPNSLTFEREPVAVILYATWQNNNFGNLISSNFLSGGSVVILEQLSTSYKPRSGLNLNHGAHDYGRKSEDGKTIYWYNTEKEATKQNNSPEFKYYYFAIFDREGDGDVLS